MINSERSTLSEWTAIVNKTADRQTDRWYKGLGTLVQLSVTFSLDTYCSTRTV